MVANYFCCKGDRLVLYSGHGAHQGRLWLTRKDEAWIEKFGAVKHASLLRRSVHYAPTWFYSFARRRGNLWNVGENKRGGGKTSN